MIIQIGVADEAPKKQIDQKRHLTEKVYNESFYELLVRLSRYAAAVWFYASDIKIRIQDSGQHFTVERIVVAQHGGQMIVGIIAVYRRRLHGAGRRSSAATIRACVMVIIGQKII